MSPSRTIRLFVPLFLLPVALAGCDILGLSDAEDSAEVVVNLINDDLSRVIHLLGPNESFSQTNKVPPGGARALPLDLVEGEAVRFRAGRNGTVLATRECVPEGVADPGFAQPSVVWTGQALACSHWTAQ